MVAILAADDEMVTTRVLTREFRRYSESLIGGEKSQIYVTNFGRPQVVMISIERFIELQALEKQAKEAKEAGNR